MNSMSLLYPLHINIYVLPTYVYISTYGYTYLPLRDVYSLYSDYTVLPSPEESLEPALQDERLR